MFDVSKVDPACIECIRSYGRKHVNDFRSGKIEKGFHLKCQGILRSYTSDLDPSQYSAEEIQELEELLDPVKWAAKYLDWHCLDPDGSIWARKNPGEYNNWVREHPGENIYGHSRYHRPYQANLLRCSSNRKVVRMGRQCLTETSLVHMSNGQIKSIKDLVPGDEVISWDSKSKDVLISKVKEAWCSGPKLVYEIKTRSECRLELTKNHPLLSIRENIDLYNGKTIDKFEPQWITLSNGLKIGDKIALSPEQELRGNRNQIGHGLKWDYIKSIKKIGKRITWDIEVEKTHNFVANGILTHNSGKSEALAISMLYHIILRPGLPEDEGFIIVLVTPYQSQIEVLFRRLEELISKSPTYKNEIQSKRKSPQYVMELKNGSRIIGFTAGTKSGAGAASARGQHAHFLAMDETDYLNANDVDAIMSIITNCPDAKLWMSSTPSGKREQFYESCQNYRWKEFHFPSWVNPLWSDELEKTFRDSMSAMAWEQEAAANFSESRQGVFQHMYIEAAQADYKYDEVVVQRNWDYTIGVDWNDEENGTTIVVIGHNRTNNKYLVVSSSIVQKEGWTQTKACQEIIRLNRIWGPKAIYVDEGFGSAQIEMLHKFGYDAIRDKQRGVKHPDAKLRKVVGYNFSSSIEVRDPWTHSKTKKPKKAFMVENAVRFFENQIINYPVSDDFLTQQLQQYEAVTTPSGNKTFKKGAAGDHSLDALMLALVAYAIEESALGKPSFQTELFLIPPSDSSSVTDSNEREVTTPRNVKRQGRAEFNELKNRDSRAGIKTTSIYDIEMFNYDRILPNSRDLPRATRRDVMRRARKSNRPKSRSF